MKIPADVLRKYEGQGYKHKGLGILENSIGTRLRLRLNKRETEAKGQEVWDAVLLGFDAANPR